MTAAADVAQSTKSTASAPTVAQPASANAIPKGGAAVTIFGDRYFNAGGAAYQQYGIKPDAPDDPTHRELTQEQWYVVLQELPHKCVGDRVGWRVFQKITEQFNCLHFTISWVWRHAQAH